MYCYYVYIYYVNTSMLFKFDELQNLIELSARLLVLYFHTRYPKTTNAERHNKRGAW